MISRERFDISAFLFLFPFTLQPRGLMMPKFTFIGWKSPTLPPETYRLSAPIAVSCGKSTGSMPSTRAAVSTPTSMPEAADST